MRAAIRVLYVDDEPGLLDIGRLFLERSGDFAVTTTTNAPDAVRLLLQERYDAIISDYQMPFMDGIEFLKTVRASGNTIPFILFTGKGREEVVIQALNEGADFYIQKGGEPGAQFAELSNQVRYAVSLRQVEEALEKRLVALTQPLEDTGIAFEDLFNIEEIQRLQDEYANATGVASVITHTDGTPITKPSNFTRLCHDIIRKTGAGCANCYKSDSIIGHPHLGGPVVQPCLSGGLWDAGASIVIGGRHIANWLIGQVRNEAQSEDTIRSYAREIGVDEQLMVEAFYEVPSMSSVKFEAIAKSLYTLANLLSKSAYQNVQQARFINERKHAEDLLRKSEEQYRRMLTTAHEGVWVLDQDWRVTFVNQHLEEMLGYPSGEILGKPLDFFIIEPDRDGLSRQRVNLEKGVPSRYEQKFMKKDGSELWTLVSATPLIDHSGAFTGTFGMLTDITDRKRVEVALQKTNKKLNLLSGITRNDINNQLLALNGLLELLHRNAPGPDMEEYFTRITKATSRIAAMIQFTRTYESIGVETPVWQECRTIVDLVVKEVHAGKVAVINDLPAGTEVFADPLLIKVYYNLVDNAVRHGETIKKVRFSANGTGGDLVIVCEDDGAGILPCEKEKVFMHGSGKNTGLGLFLSREVLDITGITIKETGEPGRGARFEIEVPKGAWRQVVHGTMPGGSR